MIDKVTIAVRDMAGMVAFYGAVLGVSFEERELAGHALQAATAGGVEFLLCPAELAGVAADVNTVQLRLLVEDVAAAYGAGLMAGGESLAEPELREGRPSAALRDLDGNSLELTEPR